MNSIDIINEYNARLSELRAKCKDVAEQMGLRIQAGTLTKMPFHAQQSEGGVSLLPTWTIQGLNEKAIGITVEFEPSPIEQDAVSGDQYGVLKVKRRRSEGFMDSPSVWTRLTSGASPSEDRNWYEGARGVKGAEIGESLLNAWFQVTGPKPLSY